MEGDAETLRARCEAPHTSETLTALVGDEAFLGSLRSSELTRLDLSGTNAARLDESWGGYRKLLLALPSTLTSLALPIGIGSSGYEGWDDGMGSVFRESEVRGAGCCYGSCVRCSLASLQYTHVVFIYGAPLLGRWAPASLHCGLIRPSSRRATLPQVSTPTLQPSSFPLAGVVWQAIATNMTTDTTMSS